MSAQLTFTDDELCALRIGLRLATEVESDVGDVWTDDEAAAAITALRKVEGGLNRPSMRRRRPERPLFDQGAP